MEVVPFHENAVPVMCLRFVFLLLTRMTSWLRLPPARGSLAAPGFRSARDAHPVLGFVVAGLEVGQADRTVDQAGAFDGSAWSAWSAGAVEQVFLGDLFPGIIGFGRVHCVRYSLAVTGWHGFP